MKLLGMLLGFFITSSPAVVLIDTSLKKPFTQIEKFSATDYINKKFPLYADDIASVSEGCEKAAKLLDHRETFSFDTVKAARSYLILNSEMYANYKVVTVRLVTVIEEEKMSFSYEIVKREADKRKVQRKLFDLAAYLTNNK